MLSALPKYTLDVGRDPKKEKTFLRMNWRSVISPWKLSCEQSGMGRQDGYDNLSLTMKKPDSIIGESLSYISKLAVYLIIYAQAFSLCCGAFCAEGRSGSFLVCATITSVKLRLVVIVLAVVMLENLFLVA